MENTRFKYLDVDGNLCGEKIVYSTSGQPYQGRFSLEDGLLSSTKDGLPAVYNLDALANSDPSQTVWLVSDEPTVLMLTLQGRLAISPAYTLDIDRPSVLKYLFNDTDLMNALEGRRIILVTNAVMNDPTGLGRIQRIRTYLKKELTSRIDHVSLQVVNLETHKCWNEQDTLPEAGEVFTLNQYLDLIEGDPLVRLEKIADDQKERQDFKNKKTTGSVQTKSISTEKAVPEEDREWMDELIRDERGRIEQCPDNVRIILLNDPYVKDAVGGINLMEGIPYRGKKVPWKHPDDLAETWKDSDLDALFCYLSREYKIRKKSIIQSGLSMVQSSYNSFHPLKDILNELSWDGKPRLDTLFIDFLGVEDTVYARAVTRKTFTAAIARIYEPGIKFDTVTVLCGSQGVGKSTILEKMSLGYFTDALGHLENKEAIENLRGKWIIELGEMVETKRSGIETQKAFLSRRIDRTRMAYQRYAEDIKRECVFVGTTNDFEFLNDVTGNRRFWPLDVRAGYNKYSVFENDPNFMLTQDYILQVLAEAKYRYESGELLILDRSLIKKAEDLQELHRATDPNEYELLNYLERPLPQNFYDLTREERASYMNGEFVQAADTSAFIQRTSVCVTEILHECFNEDTPVSSKGIITSNKIGKWLRRFGWRSGNPSTKDNVWGKTRYFTREN